MNLAEPTPSAFDLRGRICGFPLRIHPLFWVSSALLGLKYYADAEAGNIGYFAFWMLAVFASILLHSLGQVLVARQFAMQGKIVLYGLGSMILGLETLPQCRQRVIVLLAGPFLQLLIVIGFLGMTETISFPKYLIDWGWQSQAANGIVIMVRINLSWGLLCLLPLWPLEGGRVAMYIGAYLGGRVGVSYVKLLSLGTIAILSFWAVLKISRSLNYNYDLNYLLHAEISSVLLLYCLLIWICNFKLLWGENDSVLKDSLEYRSPPTAT